MQQETENMEKRKSAVENAGKGNVVQDWRGRKFEKWKMWHNTAGLENMGQVT